MRIRILVVLAALMCSLLVAAGNDQVEVATQSFALRTRDSVAARNILIKPGTIGGLNVASNEIKAIEKPSIQANGTVRAANTNKKETAQQSITYKDNTPLTVATVMLVVVAAIAVGSAIIIGLYVFNHWRRRLANPVHSNISFDYT